MPANLTYFDGRGHGERVRYALAAAQLPYTETLLKSSPAEFAACAPRCLFGQVPLLEGLEGFGTQPFGLVQSWSIVRFLARYNNLTPSDPYQAFKADATAELVRDLSEAGGFVGFGWSDKEAGKAKMQAACTKFFPKFEQHLSPFTCGAVKCWADYQLLYVVNYAVEVLGEGVLLTPSFPKLASLRDALNKEPHMASFLATQAKGLVDEQYMKEVDAVLGR